MTLFCFGLFFVACDNTEEPVPAEAEASLIITSGRVFAPVELTAPAGAVVAVINQDEAAHSITSQSAPDAYDNDGTFDVLIPANGTNTFTLPIAPSGTVYYYYCRFYEETMTTPTGLIEIE